MKLFIKTPPTSNFRPVWAIAGLALIILAAGIIFGFAWARKTVTLVDNGKEITIKTRSATVQDLLESQKVVLGPEDRVNPGLPEKLADGARVVISRAHSITLTADNKKTEFYSVAKTVGDVLKEKGVTLGGEDIVSPGAAEIITGDSEIKVVRVHTENQVINAAIPCDIKRLPNPDMACGLTRTISPGQSGKEAQTWKVTYHDNQEVSRELIDRKVISNPVERVVQVGTGQTVSRGGEVIRFKVAKEMVATAYTYTGHNTVNGTKPAYGTVAVDPSVIPYGTRMYIEGYGYGTALDKGSAIKGDRLDLFVESENEARRWGVRRVKVYLME